ncbi:MAG: methyltransferase domain-containing protein [Pseudomonadota bacterium]
MHLDVSELREFYYRSALGRAVQRSVRDQLLRLWPEARRQTVVGYGFAVPLLRPYLADARRVAALMPGPQGVMPWPAGQKNISVLCEETRWPLEASSVDKLIINHGLDTSEHPGAVMEECYRVLAENGRAIFIVPNRASLWARQDGTPFSVSRPYSVGQLEKRLKWHGFLPTSHVTALYQPPSVQKFWLKVGPTVERIGQRIPAWRGGGVLMAEVKKQVPRPARPGLGQILAKSVGVLDGIGTVEPARRNGG